MLNWQAQLALVFRKDCPRNLGTRCFPLVELKGMWNTYDLPVPMGAMWIEISPAPGLHCLSTSVPADFGKTMSVQVPVPVSEYGPLIEKSIPY